MREGYCSQIWEIEARVNQQQKNGPNLTALGHHDCSLKGAKGLEGISRVNQC
jgi:hypothetical protein